MQRALFTAMDKWATAGTPPPPSRFPKLSDGTLVKPDQASTGFPRIPGVTYTGFKTTRYLLNYGPNFYATGIPTLNPPKFQPPYQDNPANGPIYPSYVPKVDADGNDIAGLRLPEVQVPLATYTGWAAPRGAAERRRLRRCRPIHPVPENQGRPRCQRRSAPVDRRAVRKHGRRIPPLLRKAIDNLVAAGYLLPFDAERELRKDLNEVSSKNLLP